MPKVYLAGAMHGLPDKGAGWRTRAEVLMPEPWIPIIPEKIELANADPATIVTTDYAAIRASAAIIVHVRPPSWGTAMELAFAKTLDIPVIGFPFLRMDLATGRPWPGSCSPWLVHHVTYFASSLVHAIGRLRDVNVTKE